MLPIPVPPWCLFLLASTLSLLALARWSLWEMHLEVLVEPKVAAAADASAPRDRCPGPWPMPFVGDKLSTHPKVLRHYWDHMNYARNWSCKDARELFAVKRLRNGCGVFRGDPVQGKLGSAWQEEPFEAVSSEFFSAPGNETNASASVRYKEPLLVYRTWFQGGKFEYGHTVGDFLPHLLWVMEMAPDARPVIEVGEGHVIKKLLAWFAPKVFERAVFVALNETFCSAGNFTLIAPRHHPAFHVQMDLYRPFRRHIERELPQPAMDKILYYSRVQQRHRCRLQGRCVLPEHSEEILKVVGWAMARFGRTEALTTFTGKTATGEAVTFQEQYAMWSSAALALGPHGTGFTNTFWMQPGSVVVEIVCSYVSSRLWMCDVKNKDGSRRKNIRSHYSRGLFPWLRSYHVFYTEDSVDEDTRVDLEGLWQALAMAWNGTGNGTAPRA